MDDTSRLGPLLPLIGTWAGEGTGVYPTIPGFGYSEEITVLDGGVKPFLAYTQRTRATDDGRPLHAETGYLRWANGHPELVIAQPTGVAEAHDGTATIDGGALHLIFTSRMLAATASAKRVDSVERRIVVTGDELTYEVWMGAVGEPHQLHLRAALRRTG
jgi:hypothetical protein